MKILSRAAFMALVLATPLAAQQPSGPPTQDPMTFVFRGRTMTLQRNLATAFDSIPETLFSYKPTAAQLTIGYIAQHLANDNYFFCNNFGAMKGTRAAEETSTADSLKAKWPKAQLVSQLKASFDFCEKAFAQLSDTTLDDRITVPGPNGTTREAIRTQYVLGHVIDMADHYSQIANYMRLNNILPPTALPRPNRP